MKYVLFVCDHNAGRSDGPGVLRALRAARRARGVGRAPPAPGGVWRPNVVEAMLEVGIDLSRRRPTKLTVEMQLHADWAITLACGATRSYVPSTVEDWDIPDPAGLRLAETRTVRDAIELRVEDLVEHRLDAIRADRTAHQHRLEHPIWPVSSRACARRPRCAPAPTPSSASSPTCPYAAT